MLLKLLLKRLKTDVIIEKITNWLLKAVGLFTIVLKIIKVNRLFIVIPMTSSHRLFIIII